MFREIGIADELGSGMRNAYKFTKLYSGGVPQFLEGDIFKTIIPLNISATMKIGPMDGDQVSNQVSNQVSDQVSDQVSNQVSDQVSDQVSNQVSDQVVISDVQKKILKYCKIARTKKEISKHIGYKSLTYMTKAFLKPLLESGQLVYTIPDKPKSRLQKYKTKQ